MKKIDSKYFKNPKKYIPNGSFCNHCPFWDKDNDKPYHMNGYCHYLNQGDWEDYGLLWDMIKECGIKDYSEWCLDCDNFTWEKDCYGKCDVLNKTVDGEGYCENFIPKKELIGD